MSKGAFEQMCEYEFKIALKKIEKIYLNQVPDKDGNIKSYWECMFGTKKDQEELEKVIRNYSNAFDKLNPGS